MPKQHKQSKQNRSDQKRGEQNKMEHNESTRHLEKSLGTNRAKWQNPAGLQLKAHLDLSAVLRC